MCPLLEKCGTFIARCNALIEKVSPCVAGALVLADALQAEIAIAVQETLAQRDARYSDGQELEKLMAQSRFCHEVLLGFCGSIWRPLSRLASAEQRALVRTAAVAVRSRYRAGKIGMRLVHRADRRKLLQLVLLGRRHFHFLVLMMGFSVLSGSIQTMYRWQNAEVMNFFTERGGNMQGFKELLTGVLMTRLIGIALSKMSNHLEKHGTLRMRVTMYRTIYAKMMAQDMSYFEEKFKQKDQARVMIFTYCNKTMQRVERTLWRVRDLSSIISSAAVLTRKNRRLLALMLIVFPFRTAFVEVMGSIRIRLRRRQDDTENFDFAELMGTLDTRASFAATRFTGRERAQQEKFRVVMSRWEKNQLKMRAIQHLMNPITQLFTTATTMIGFYFGGRFVLAGAMTPADLVTFVEEANRLVMDSRNLMRHFTEMYKDMRDPLIVARFNAVSPEIGLEGRRPDGFEYIVPSVSPSEFDWTIECKNVTFWYPSDSSMKPVFRGLNLVIHHGETVGICGQTGCGKSTLLRLLVRLYDVQRGQILLNGRDIRDFEPAWLREQFAFVTSVKDTFLFSTSIAENIEFGNHPSGTHRNREHVSEPERIRRVEEAAALAELLETVRAMPNGLNTRIGDRSEENLSDGQVQRLSLARGFMKDAEVMLLDEPTSALDPIVEVRIVKAIRRRLSRAGRNRNAVIVAHRISTITSCDRILYFEQHDVAAGGGAYVAEEGTHADMLARNGKYAKFVRQLNEETQSAANAAITPLGCSLATPLVTEIEAAAAALEQVHVEELQQPKVGSAVQKLRRALQRFDAIDLGDRSLSLPQ
eukprot:SAG31_NODE_1897_length_6964_cov_2.677349_4_plen_815_part_00